jgi:hypothetical protein
MKVRRLTLAGLQRLNSFLDSLTTAVPDSVPTSILTDSETSEPLEGDVEIECREFETRFEFSQYLDSRLTDTALSDISRDIGLWAWLALHYVEQLCPTDATGRRRPGERARWVADVNNFRKYYRHLVAGPYRVYRAHRDDPSRVRAMLAGPVDQPGEIFEQLASHQELVTNKGAMAVVTALYLNPKTGRTKRGAAGRGRGSARRLVDVFNQYELTWDLYAMSTPEMLDLLPREFDRFKSTTV